MEIRHEKYFSLLYWLGMRRDSDAGSNGRSGDGGDELPPVKRSFEDWDIRILHGNSPFAHQKKYFLYKNVAGPKVYS